MSDEMPKAPSWIFRYVMSCLRPVLHVGFSCVCGQCIELPRWRTKRLYVLEGVGHSVCPPAYTVPETGTTALSPASAPTMW